MRILHVVTWVAPGNPFGGPLRVAANDADELRRRGHHVDLVAAQPLPRGRRGWRSTDQGVRGYNAVRLIPGAGFSGVVSPGLLWHVWTRGRSYDVVHVHLARDLVTLPAAAATRLRKVAYVVQAHGMIDTSSRRLARLLDRVLTRRVLDSAGAVIVLTDIEQRDVAAAFAGQHFRFETVPNGVPTSAGRTTACGRAVPEILFCSRLHVRKRPVLFAEMAAGLLDSGVEARFTMIGADEGELGPVRDVLARAARGADVEVAGAVEPGRVADCLASCDVLVLPSVDEPFPMVILEAMAVGRPVIVTDTCGLAPFVTTHACGIVVPGDDLPALMAAARQLIEDPGLRQAMGAAGRLAAAQELGMSGVGDRLERLYRTAIGAGR